MAQLHSGQLVAARDSFASLREVAADLDLSQVVSESFFGLHPFAMALMYSARSAWTVGEEAQACAFAHQGVCLATSLGHPHTLAFAWFFDSHLHVLLGDARGVVERSAQADALCEEHGLTAYRGWFRLLEGWAISQRGRAEEGAAEIALQIEVNQASGARINAPFFLSLHAECEMRRGNYVRALSLVEEAVAGIGEVRLWESQLHRQRGELLVAQGPEHRAEAVSALRRAVSIAEAQDGVPFAERARAALAVLEPPADPSQARSIAESSNLSRREREVLALVGRGLTDNEIATDLVISLATVRSHLDRIRDKTGRRRRPGLTRLADELGLTRD